MPGKVLLEIIYPFPNFNGATVEVWELLSNIIPHFMMDVITYPYWDKRWSMLVKLGTGAAGAMIQLSDAWVYPQPPTKLIWHQIGSIHLSHCFHIFPWLCAWDVCYIIFCHLLYIHSGKTGNWFSSLLCSLWWAQIVGYVLACRSYSFVCILHHLIIIIVQTLSEDIELIKCLSDIICRVCE